MCGTGGDVHSVAASSPGDADDHAGDRAITQGAEGVERAAGATVHEVRVIVPSAYLCFLSMRLMRDPVIAADGHTFDRPALIEWLTHSSISPVTGHPLVRRCNSDA